MGVGGQRLALATLHPIKSPDTHSTVGCVGPEAIWIGMEKIRSHTATVVVTLDRSVRLSLDKGVFKYN